MELLLGLELTAASALPNGLTFSAGSPEARAIAAEHGFEQLGLLWNPANTRAILVVVAAATPTPKVEALIVDSLAHAGVAVSIVARFPDAEAATVWARENG